MKNLSYPELHRVFEDSFPQVKWLVKNFEQFYEGRFEELPNLSKSGEFGSAHQIGELLINKNDDGLLLPRLFFKKNEGEKTNPPFYEITTPDGGILYVGTSAPSLDKSVTSLSVSAMTGGVFPPVDTKDAYFPYLGVMFAAKKFGKCNVYSLDTGYENINIHDQFNFDITNRVKKATVGQIYESLYNSVGFTGLPCINKSKSDYRMINGMNEIWRYVSAFKTICGSEIVLPSEKKEDKQIITLIPIAGGLKISFSKKVKFENDYSPLSDKFVASHIKEASKLMNDEKFWKNVETSVNTLNPSKVMAYFNEQYKEYPVPGEDTRVPIIREATSTKQNEFEKKIKKPSFGNVSFRYVNIPGSKGSRVLFDGGNSYIEIYGECANPTLFEMQEILEAVTTAFGIDDGETRISTEAVESALNNE